jgi:hypothetical protein
LFIPLTQRYGTPYLYTNGTWYIACVCQLAVPRLQWWHSQLTLHARNILSAVYEAPSEDEQAMLKHVEALDSQ